MAVAFVLTASACLVPPFREQADRLKTVLDHSGRSLATTSFDQRRLAFYGDCDRFGFGYVRRMLARFPEAAQVPVLRNPRWDPRIVPVVLPGFRRGTDDRALKAIGVTDDDTTLANRPWLEPSGGPWTRKASRSGTSPPMTTSMP